MAFTVYLLASGPSGTLYVGMTDDLARRVHEHREKLRRGFTRTYGVTRLVWYEMHDTREAAFARERQIKKWRRAWKIELIQRMNPEWTDLYETLQN
ncbi:GIY-YIG nuclease family protein [Amorphus sp. 3PC139-8]|uniref:GIY-YIG nuclease family protein n=1 Tax=Amorphus sp. 3PC139-8 TaxID=2735676 RepID=UPI00345D7B4A